MKISIVTVNYNNFIGLKSTIKSVQEQDNKLFEHIIIDGGSTDGSKELIESNEHYLSYWVSEKDKGVYNAMNKGVKQCTGNYIIFLNSGDTFYAKNVINNFVNTNPKEDLIYGDVNVKLLSGKQKIKKMPDQLPIGITLNFTITHQAIFHKKKLFIDVFYSETFKIISDWIFYNEAILLKKATYKHINVVVVNFEGGGLSSNVALAEKERELYIKNKYSKEFYNLLKGYNTLNIRYNAIQNLFFVNLFFKLKNYIKTQIK